MSLDGFLVVDKPSGVTSFSIVSLVRRLTGTRRVGHAGTLDPLASGVLPVALGSATRLIEFLDEDHKTYIATLRLGVETDTYDAEGAVTAESDASPVRESDVRDALASFVGVIEQTPPVYSAIKVAGKPLYRYAREGGDVPQPRPRTVRIDAIDLLRYEPPIAEIEVRCGPGTYIRSLAHDAGARLRCGAHLAALRRTRSGGFGIEYARTPEELRAAAGDGWLEELLLAPDRAVERMPAAILGGARARDVAEGRDIALERRSEAAWCRAYTLDGHLAAMLTAGPDGRWRPRKVLLGPSKTADPA